MSRSASNALSPWSNVRKTRPNCSIDCRLITPCFANCVPPSKTNAFVFPAGVAQVNVQHQKVQRSAELLPVQARSAAKRSDLGGEGCVGSDHQSHALCLSAS